MWARSLEALVRGRKEGLNDDLTLGMMPGQRSDDPWNDRNL